jgi:hypothetical protein
MQVTRTREPDCERAAISGRRPWTLDREYYRQRLGFGLDAAHRLAASLTTRSKSAAPSSGDPHDYTITCF